MGFQGVGAGGMGNSDAALITQMRSVVESTLVDEDAKLNLVKDYGSDRTVSHRGSWSVFSPLVNSRRIQEIRTAFADALNSMTGRVDGGSTGNPELDSIIDQLKASSKPLTKREVRRVLDKASAFIDAKALETDLKANETACKNLQREANKLSEEVKALSKSVQDAEGKKKEGILTEAVALKAKLVNAIVSLQKTDHDVQELLGKDANSADGISAKRCQELQESSRGLAEELKTLRNELADLQSRYQAEFVYPKIIAENDEKEQKILANQEEIALAEKDIQSQKEGVDLAALEKRIGDLKREIVELQGQIKMPGAADAKGTPRMVGNSVVVGRESLKSKTIRHDIRDGILAKIPNFNQWLEGMRNEVFAAMGFNEGEHPATWKRFQEVWKADMTPFVDENGNYQDLVADKVRDALSQLFQKLGVTVDADRKELSTLTCDLDRLKQDLKARFTARYANEQDLAGWKHIERAETNFKLLASKNDVCQKLDESFNQWKSTRLEAVKGVLSKEAFQALQQKIESGYRRFADVVNAKTLLCFDDMTGDDLTLFNHLVENLAEESVGENTDLFEIVGRDLSRIVSSYKLVEGNSGTIQPKLTLPTKANNAWSDLRQTQNEEDGPKAIITKLLGAKPSVGLIQKGGNSCWMISVVNGLLTTDKGRKILEECFKDPDKCVFKARTNAGGTKTIEVTKDDIDDLMSKKGGVALSRLEAAIWLGVKKMAEDKDHLFDVNGYALGEQGEASEAATLFGLRNAETGDGKSMGDNDTVWVTGANALHGNRLVVLRRGARVDNGHFMTAVGTDFKAGANDKAPEKSFYVQDSLANDPTVALTSEQLNVNAKLNRVSYTVLTFEIPEA